MRRAIQKIFLFSALVISAMGFSGCLALAIGAAAGAGAAGYAWVNGSLVKEFNVTAVDLREATKRAVVDLDMQIIEDRSDRLSARIRSEFADGQSVTINIDALTELSSKISIRVGLLGDKTKSEMIYNAIQGRL